ncbi:hypothetical protein HYS90_01520 [Candidatus Curtissbacteria bacterium]|nr:hypothetical protein [Candidatus Curtissbacteria bacterium]
MFGQEEKKPEETETTSKINPEVLSTLGLTQEDLDKYNQEKLEEERHLNSMRLAGAREYEKYVQGVSPSLGYSVTIDVLEGKPPLTCNTFLPDAIPDGVLEQLGRPEVRQLFNEEEIRKAENRLKAFIEGFGQKALMARNWRTAVTAYDVITDGGIMQNQEVLGSLREITQSSKADGVDIARAIQERVNRRRQGPEPSLIQPQSPGPTPEPGLRPVPQLGD